LGTTIYIYITIHNNLCTWLIESWSIRIFDITYYNNCIVRSSILAPSDKLPDSMPDPRGEKSTPKTTSDRHSSIIVESNSLLEMCIVCVGSGRGEENIFSTGRDHLSRFFRHYFGPSKLGSLEINIFRMRSWTYFICTYTPHTHTHSHVI